MATGVLGQASIAAANTNQTIYTVPGSTTATVNINLLNKAASTCSVRVAISAADTPTDAEYIEYGTVLPANGVLERNGIALNAAKKVVVHSTSTDVNVFVHGYEE